MTHSNSKLVRPATLRRLRRLHREQRELFSQIEAHLAAGGKHDQEFCAAGYYLALSTQNLREAVEELDPAWEPLP